MESFFSSMAGAALAAGATTSIFGLLLGTWLVHRLTLTREAETRANALREKRREDSRAVAEILSEWVRSSYTGQFTNEDRWKLQTVYWKNILGLDRALIDVLFPRLANAPNAVSPEEVIVQARRILLGLDKADIPADGLNHWLPEESK